MSSRQPIKVMYFGPKPADRSHEAFRARWRQHGALAMGLPMWDHHIHYEQFDVLTAGEEGLLPEQAAMAATETYGGVGMIWMRDADAMAAVLVDPDVSVMQTDEVETFGAELGESLVPTIEHVIYERGPGRITLIGRIVRQPDITRQQFSEQWAAMGPQVAATSELTRHCVSYRQNHALPDAAGADGFVQMGFDSAQDLAAFMAEPKIAEWLLPTEAAFVDASRLELVFAKQNVLYDEASDTAAAASAPATA
jgi:hypothetical protein